MSVAHALIALAATATLAAAPQGGAAPAWADLQYKTCVAGVEQEPARARELAALWITEGGGAPAYHCQALADLALGNPKLAAVRLSELAERSDAGDALVRARLMGQAALAFLEAGDAAAAEDAIKAAYALAPGGGELDLIAAKLDLQQGRNQAAVDAVSKAETQGLVSPAGYVTRARAYIALQQPRDAAEDIVAALQLDPLNIDALTVRGELAALGVAIDIHLKAKPERR